LVSADRPRLAQANDTRTLRLGAPRGLMLGAGGEILASDRSQFAIYALPTVAYDSATLGRISTILGQNIRDIAAMLKTEKKNNYDPVRIALNVPIETVAMVEENRPFLPGITSAPEPVRWYPRNSFLCATLGTLGRIDENQYRKLKGNGYYPDDFVGKTGLECMYESYLHGSPGGTIVKINARGRPTNILGQRAAAPGKTLELTVMPALQSAAEACLDKHDWVGGAVAIDPRTGAVLAMASRPTFDPNLFATGIDKDRWDRINNDPEKPMLNRTVDALYPPGSTFKQVVAAAGLESGTIGPQSSVYCPGFLKLGKARFGCWKVHGEIDFYGAIADSCDVFFYRAGLAMGADYLAAFAKQYPLARLTGIDLPHEMIGTIPSPAWKAEHFAGNDRSATQWYGGDTLNTSIGQGFVLTTPLQMALVTATTATDGLIVKPYLVSRIVDPTTQAPVFTRQQPPEHRIRCSTATLEAVRRGMRLCVTDGTGKIVKFDEVEVAAKTGSAQVHGDERTHGWFVAFAPYDHPTIAVAAIVEHGGHGADSAGRVVRAVLRAYFGLKADDEPSSVVSD